MKMADCKDSHFIIYCFMEIALLLLFDLLIFNEIANKILLLVTKINNKVVFV